MKKNDKILISESELIELISKKGYAVVGEARTAKSNFKGVLQNLGSAADKMMGIYKRTTSGAEDYSTKSSVMRLIVESFVISGQKNIKIIETSRFGSERPPSEDRIISPFKTDMFTTTMFSGCLTYIRSIAATYDNGLFATTSTGTPASSAPPIYQGVVRNYTTDKKIVPVSEVVSNTLKNGGVLPPLNQIIEGFNTMFRSISEIPEDAGYRDGVYAATNIANDIVKIFRPYNSAIKSEPIKVEIMKNIQKKQSVAFGMTLNPDKKVQLKPGAMRELASEIVKDLRDYVIDSLSKSKSTIRQSLADLNVLVDQSSGGVHFFDDAPQFNNILSDIDKFIDSLRNINIK